MFPVACIPTNQVHAKWGTVDRSCTVVGTLIQGFGRCDPTSGANSSKHRMGRNVGLCPDI
jgi:hypothetical protein